MLRGHDRDVFRLATPSIVIGLSILRLILADPLPDLLFPAPICLPVAAIIGCNRTINTFDSGAVNTVLQGADII